MFLETFGEGTSKQSCTSNLEPSFSGLPRRIWRGKIVEALRNVNGNGSLTLIQLGKTVKNNFKKKDIQWFSDIIGRLEKDGIVRKHKNGMNATVSLAHE